MTRSELVQAWIDYCRSVAGPDWTVTRAEELTGSDGPKPNGPFLTLKIISGPSRLTIDDELRFNGNTEGDKNFDLVALRSYVLTIQAFREGSADILEDLITCLNDPELRQILRENGCISPTTSTSVINTTTALDTGFESRHSVDISFNSVKVKETGIGLIESVEVSGSVFTGNGGKVDTNAPPISKE